MRLDFFQIDCVGIELFGQVVSSIKAAIGNDHAADMVIVEVSCHQLYGLAGADQQGSLLGEVSEYLLGQTDGSECHGYGTGADGGIGANLFGYREGILK